ncbi:thiamine-phosphate kinase [Haloarcula salinisoli]|uniref:Thiamine-monophosphate kinase n=1 Tax=Haloarcula salinisoli TaxID=2487746 RepID=A0A8J7YFQ7_9EURY|nr:thiamine-phosphate kinase [Halomicroarcula salinisoli]MBX0287743.1 thiamine-phosphate kinase [Halomicroarcula salinisoli]MBX0304667.1 thiamine-phosphate kinase [Halomicroarcula salinisoli]
MDEQTALGLIGDRLAAAGDDCAVVDGQVITTDMLHERTDFPAGTTRYTAGWRAVGASLSDVAAMGATATAAVAVYAAPEFDGTELGAFLDGATAVCDAVGAEYVGGDLDGHDEFTVATTALGETDDPVRRSGAEPGDALCVTGSLGRTAAAIRLFDRGDIEAANELFRFTPRVAAGRALSPYASAMLDSSDGLARSVHQLVGASDCGAALTGPLPIDERVDEVAEDDADRRELGVFFGEDFELVCAIPEAELGPARDVTHCRLHRVGTVTESGVTHDGDPLPDRGYSH